MGPAIWAAMGDVLATGHTEGNEAAARVDSKITTQTTTAQEEWRQSSIQSDKNWPPPPGIHL